MEFFNSHKIGGHLNQDAPSVKRKPSNAYLRLSGPLAETLIEEERQNTNFHGEPRLRFFLENQMRVFLARISHGCIGDCGERG